MLLVLAAGCPSDDEGGGGDASDGGVTDGPGAGEGDGGGEPGSAGNGSSQGGRGAGGDAGIDSEGAGAGGGGNGGSSAAADAGPAPGDGSIVRTLVYHQVSTFTASPNRPSAIAENGSHIVYTIAPGTGDEATPNRIFVIDPDGSGNQEVDSYKTGCFCESKVAISDDGTTVVSTDATQVHVVGSDATTMGTLNFDSNEVSDIAISGDGGAVFMVQRRNNNITGGAPVERGVWTADANGGNHEQLVGPSAIATLVGATADQVFPFAGCGKSLEVSADATRLVFAVEVGGMGQFAMTFDGGGVHALHGPVQFVNQVSISSDGSTVAVSTTDQGETEVLVMGFDGGGKRTVTTQSQGSCFSPLTLSDDGSRLLSGDTALLFDTAGGDPVLLYQLTGGDGEAQGGPWHEGTGLFAMTGDAERFVYWNWDAANVMQLGLLELDPDDLGGAPAISNPRFSESSIPRDRSVGSKVSCEIADASLVRAGTAVLLHGVEDTAGSWLSREPVMRDDGMGSDQTADDGVFTSDPITSGEGGEVGPRLIRIKAESKTGDKRHATAIDVSGFEVE